MKETPLFITFLLFVLTFIFIELLSTCSKLICRTCSLNNFKSESFGVWLIFPVVFLISFCICRGVQEAAHYIGLWIFGGTKTIFPYIEIISIGALKVRPIEICAGRNT